MTAVEDRSAEIARQLAYFDQAMELIDRGIFKIQTKNAGLMAYVPKREQQQLYALVRREIARGKPCKVMILKARQIGFSTAIAILFLALALVRDVVDVVVAAHEEKSRNRIWKIYQIAWRNLPAEYTKCKDPDNGKLVGRARYDSRRELEFKDTGSHIAVHVAGKGELGRSGATHLAHLSEFARWKNQKEDLNSVMNSVPKFVGSIAFIETTANGWGDHFHDMWLQAEGAEDEKRLPEWNPFFSPWWKDSEYSMPLPRNTRDGGRKKGRADWVHTDAEVKLVDEIKRRYSWNISRPQLQWRRSKIEGDCGGDVRLFDQENPSTPEHAFLSTGEHVFDPEALDWQINKFVDEPIGTYEVELSMLGDPLLRPYPEVIDEKSNVPTRGRFRVYRHPENRECLLMADPTHGVSEQSDPAALHVFDVATLEQLAVWEGRVDQHQFGDICTAIAKHYNQAFSVIESNIGLTTLTRMQELGFHNIHWHKPHGHHHADPTWQPGFRTTSASRDACIRLLKRLLHERIPVLYDPRTLKELQAFQEVRTGTKFKAQAPKDKCDNLVMALAIGLYVGNERHNWTTNGKLMQQRKFDPPELKKRPEYTSETTEQAAARFKRQREKARLRAAFDCR